MNKVQHVYTQQNYIVTLGSSRYLLKQSYDPSTDEIWIKEILRETDYDNFNEVVDGDSKEFRDVGHIFMSIEAEM